jgi:molybdenum cofactor biosynthesis enzyme
MASKQINPNGLAIVETLTAHKGETLAFAEIANLAKVDAKTGYLTSAKKIAAERKMRIEKVEDGVTAKVKTITAFPNGLTVEAEKEVSLDGYRIVDAE